MMPALRDITDLDEAHRSPKNAPWRSADIYFTHRMTGSGEVSMKHLEYYLHRCTYDA